nr:hypothetical protein [Tanacetum cinerariifolium]
MYRSKELHDRNCSPRMKISSGRHKFVMQLFVSISKKIGLSKRFHPHSYRHGLYKREEHQLGPVAAVCISAYVDNLNLADTLAFTENIGAFTFSFINAIETERKQTYERLLASMRKVVNQAQQVLGRFVLFASFMSQPLKGFRSLLWPMLNCLRRLYIYSIIVGNTIEIKQHTDKEVCKVNNSGKDATEGVKDDTKETKSSYITKEDIEQQDLLHFEGNIKN